MYRFLCKCKFSLLWDKGLGVQLLGCMVAECLVYKELPNCFSEWLCHFTSCQLGMNDPVSEHSLASLWCCLFFILPIVIGVL